MGQLRTRPSGTLASGTHDPVHTPPTPFESPWPPLREPAAWAHWEWVSGLLRATTPRETSVRCRAFCQGFCRLFDLKLATLDDALAGGESLAANSRFPQRVAPFSTLRLQQKRPYFLDREYTETVRRAKIYDDLLTLRPKNK